MSTKLGNLIPLNGNVLRHLEGYYTVGLGSERSLLKLTTTYLSIALFVFFFATEPFEAFEGTVLLAFFVGDPYIGSMGTSKLHVPR